MDFFNKIGKKVSETYKSTAKAADSIAKEVKLKAEINDIKDEIDEEYREIGERVYFSRNNDENSGLEDYISQAYIRLDDLFKSLNEKKVEILKLKNKTICPKCNTEIDCDVAFCPKCGEKQEVEEITQEDIEQAEATENKEEQSDIENKENE